MSHVDDVIANTRNDDNQRAKQHKKTKKPHTSQPRWCDGSTVVPSRI